MQYLILLGCTSMQYFHVFIVFLCGVNAVRQKWFTAHHDCTSITAVRFLHQYYAQIHSYHLTTVLLIEYFHYFNAMTNICYEINKRSSDSIYPTGQVGRGWNNEIPSSFTPFMKQINTLFPKLMSFDALNHCFSEFVSGGFLGQRQFYSALHVLSSWLKRPLSTMSNCDLGSILGITPYTCDRS